MVSPAVGEPARNLLIGILAILVVAALGAAYVFQPALSGYHIGYNWASDTACMSRVFEWCKSGPVARSEPSAPPPPTAGKVTPENPRGLPDCQVAPEPCYNNPSYP